MKKLFLLFVIIFLLWGVVGSNLVFAQVPKYDQTLEGYLVFHDTKTDTQGKIIPWYSADLGS